MGTSEASEFLTIRVLIRHERTQRPLSRVGVEAVGGDRVIAEARTDDDGAAGLQVAEDLWREPLAVRIAGGDDEIPVTRGHALRGRAGPDGRERHRT